MIEADEIEMLKSLILKETIYLRHYNAKVVKTEDITIGDSKTFRVHCLPADLGMFSDEQSIIAYPRQNRSVIRPEKGEYVELYFLNGHPDFPVFLYPSVEIGGNGFKKLNPDGIDTIYQSNDDVCSFTYDKKKKVIAIGEDVTEINFGKDGKGVARLDDTIVSNMTTDSSFWSWVTAVSSSLSSLGFPVTPVPTALNGKINLASEKVNAE